MNYTTGSLEDVINLFFANSNSIMTLFINT